MEKTIQIFSSDLDGTLLGEQQSRKQFIAIWNALSADNRPILCYNTGRMLDDILALIANGKLPEPEYIISGVGTSIYDFRERRVIKAFSDILEEGWSVEQVATLLRETDLPLEAQPTHYQNAYKSSWYFNDATNEQIESIEQTLEAAGLDTHVVYSSGRHLDILPKWANKGNALRWLANHLNILGENILVAGDSGNDSAMFALKKVRGIVVGNAQPELRDRINRERTYVASDDAICASAVLKGLFHFGILPNDVARIEELTDEQILLYETLRTWTDEEVIGVTQEQLAFIRHGYHQAISALKKTITPLGFAACSLDENETIGTDANYRSVWARDGAITVIGSLPLFTQDEAIRKCQRQTLQTLLDHIAPNGQLPINVRIDDGKPEYCGVGGIAAVDSCMWVVLACYEWVKISRDMPFLRQYWSHLEQVMSWLSAHDSNNDALIEIPEAADWTDLFGRSYNVLYDEVLWYRVNRAFARMLQMMGDEQRAGDYLRWSRIIKKEINNRFWPTTRPTDGVSFADTQYSLGDARYLIAQITPFDFSWRCDTFGNVLAWLYDVIDERMAARAFRFMWGVGVNEPYPIANLYPVVIEGNKDWREYYTVNLLNLPHHYHNGGIWPFVGGFWVRFIHKLGLRDVALNELYRLAELNKLGLQQEWEFNEWAHGRTGRPMGKAYQAWSASEFIRACHDLHVIA